MTSKSINPRGGKSATSGETVCASPLAESSRQALIEVGKRLFARNGFAGTSIKVLSDLAKVNASLVSYHFGGKLGLYRACVSSLFDRETNSPERLLEKTNSAVEFRLRTRLFLEELLGRYAEDPDAFKMVYQGIENEDALGDELTKRVFQMFDRHVAFMTEAKSEGLLNDGIDPEAASSMLFGVITNLMRSDHMRQKHLGKSIRDPEHRKQLIEQIIRIFFDGVLPPNPSHARGSL